MPKLKDYYRYLDDSQLSPPKRNVKKSPPKREKRDASCFDNLDSFKKRN